MEGTGVPLVTPFDATGEVAETKLRDLVGWLENRGVDFVVPCGSTGEAPLVGVEEATRVIEVVADAAEGPVLAGTGRPGLRQTGRATRLAAEAGADAALVVTPYYYGHDEDAMATHYRHLADESPIPVYIYSVPKFTGTTLSPRTVEALAAHKDIRGMKDSAGDLDTFQRTRALAPGIDLLVGHGGLYAHALEAGADGGVLAVANAAPELAVEVHERHAAGDEAGARELNRRLLELNRAVTARYGVPGAKAALRLRGAPAGDPRRPLESLDGAGERAIASLLDDLDLL
jgi:4-hydroxy-tetrahydrodipicolinate synthase/4-hydroxy-2-oxoglutarate aldolase